MSTHVRANDPQLQLSILFLAIADSKRHEAQRRVTENEQTSPDETEWMHEEPERWDGLL
jgi:hypothetical protein